MHRCFWPAERGQRERRALLGGRPNGLWEGGGHIKLGKWPSLAPLVRQARSWTGLCRRPGAWEAALAGV